MDLDDLKSRRYILIASFIFGAVMWFLDSVYIICKEDGLENGQADCFTSMTPFWETVVKPFEGMFLGFLFSGVLDYGFFASLVILLFWTVIAIGLIYLTLFLTRIFSLQSG